MLMTEVPPITFNDLIAEPWLEGAVMSMATPENERMVRAYVAALSRDPAEVDDLTQEVFVRAIERAHRLHSPDHIPRFLRGIARRVVQEHFRQRRRSHREVELMAQALAADERSVAALCHDRAMLVLLREAIVALPVVSRRMLEMRYEQGMSAPQIGRALGIRPTAVRVSLLRIRERLRRRIEDAARRSQF